jgi:hypothetical protein
VQACFKHLSASRNFTEQCIQIPRRLKKSKHVGIVGFLYTYFKSNTFRSDGNHKKLYKHNPKIKFYDSIFGKLHVQKWFTIVCEPHREEVQKGMQKVHWGGKMVLRAYSKGASNGIVVGNNPVLQPNTSPIMHTKCAQML